MALLLRAFCCGSRRLEYSAEPLVASKKPAIDPIGSTLLRSHGVEIREHGLDRLALAVRTRRVRLLVFGDVLLTLEDRAAFRASEFIGRHSRCLQAASSCVDGPYTHALYRP